MNVQEGSTLGPYRLMERIGRGGMASVYRAYHAALDRYVAIKVLPDFFADEPGYRERFQQEARSVARLKHPNILGIGTSRSSRTAPSRVGPLLRTRPTTTGRTCN